MSPSLPLAEVERATPASPLPLPRRFFVETWGCQMNELDSQRMAGQLMQQGILPTRDPEEADLILLNSCSVREKAAQKAYSRLGEYRLIKRRRPHLLIGFCGCVAQPRSLTFACLAPGRRIRSVRVNYAVAFLVQFSD